MFLGWVAVPGLVLSQIESSASLRSTLNEKLDATNEVMAGLLHEIRNPLSFVLNAHQLAHIRLRDLRSKQAKSLPKEVLGELDQVLKDLDLAENQAHRLDKRLKNFHHQICYFEQKSQFINLGHLFCELCCEVNEQMSSEKQIPLQFRFYFDQWLPLCYVERPLFRKLLMHILMNICNRILLLHQDMAHEEQTLSIRVGFHGGKLKILLCHGFEGDDRETFHLPRMYPLRRWRPLSLGVALSWCQKIIEERYQGQFSVSDPESLKVIFLIELPYRELAGCDDR